jgi:hypothetical protein
VFHRASPQYSDHKRVTEQHSQNRKYEHGCQLVPGKQFSFDLTDVTVMANHGFNVTDIVVVQRVRGVLSRVTTITL